MLMSQTLLILLSQWLFMTCQFGVKLRRKYSGRAHPTVILICPNYGRDMLAF